MFRGLKRARSRSHHWYGIIIEGRRRMPNVVDLVVVLTHEAW